MFGKKQVIGVDIGSDSIKILELQSKKNGYELVRAVIEELPENVFAEGSIIDYSEIINALSKAFKRGKFSHKNVGAALKGNDVIVKRVQVNVPDIKHFDESFRWEAEQYIQMNIEDVNLDYEILKYDETTSQAEVILAVAKKDLIADIVSVLESAKLKPVLVDLEVFALMNCFEANYGRDDSVSLIINVGHYSSILVYVKNGIYEFSRTVDLGGKHCIEEIQKKKNYIYDDAKLKLLDKESIEFDEEMKEAIGNFNERLVSEIKNSINYFYSSTQQVVSKIYLCGGAALTYNLKESIEQGCEVEAILFNPFANIEIGKNVDEDIIKQDLYKFNVACGLSFRRVDGK